MPELTATLIVSTTHSYCGHCRKNTLPHDGQGAPITHHVDICGYSPKPGGGCGARFVDISTDCWGVTPEQLREIRPDLPVQGHGERPAHSWLATVTVLCPVDCPATARVQLLADALAA